MGNISDKKNDALIQGPIDVKHEHTDSISVGVLSEDGSLLVTGCDDFKVRFFSTKTSSPKCLGVLSGHTKYITGVAISGSFVVSFSADGTIRKWDMPTQECLYVYQGHSERITKGLCTSDLIISASADHTAICWKLDPEDDDPMIMKFKGHTGSILCLVFIPELEGVSQECKDINFNPGDRFITGSSDATAISWDVTNGKRVKIFKGHNDGITLMATDPPARRLYTASYDNTIGVWNILTGKRLTTIIGHSAGITSMLVVNQMMFTGCQHGTVRSWNRDIGDCVRIFHVSDKEQCAISSIKFIGGILYVASANGKVSAYNASNGDQKAIYEKHEKAINFMAVTEEKIFTGSSDGKLMVWNTIKLPKWTRHDDDENEIYQNKKRERQERDLNDLEKQLDTYLNEIPQNDIVANAN